MEFIILVMKKNKVLAVASAGGHWKQLILLKASFDDCSTVYVTTLSGLPEQSGITNYNVVLDSNQNEKLAVLYSLFQLLFIFIRVRPDVVITTGASPGVLAIVLGRLFFSKTIWIDSIANSQKLSMGGSISKRLAHKVIVQWESLVQDNVVYSGSVF
jgi:UDP-N-acetylglucosamine:LPS N-acetylglucosamine transferase